ncbi:MAG: amidohydrolase [Robiginitomaculum sp.]|nr:MAG: amidohydrolase [Robiginitomaculum sp.]
MKSYISVSGLAISVALAACNDSPQSEAHKNTYAPDLCIERATVYTGEGDVLTKGVIYITDGVIEKVFSSQTRKDCSQFPSDKTQIISLKNAYIYPGFVDAHSHLMHIGLRELTLNLEDIPSIDCLKQRLAATLKDTPSTPVIFGRGWIETHWPENRFPTRQDLDEIAPNIPVILERADGHAFVVNSKALEMSGITKNTKPPFGGDILIGKDGTPTGMLIDAATTLVSDLLPKMSFERRKAGFIKGGEVYAAYGWTGTHSMSTDPLNIEMLENLSDTGKIGLRVYNGIDMNNAEALLESIAKDGPRTSKNGHIITRGIKLYMDGALGSRGAALLAPYDDDPENIGLMLSEKQATLPILENALRNGIQIFAHAIGDRANRNVLDWFEEAFANVPESERKVVQPRWRIEHSQILNTKDIGRFAKLGVIASMQPSHAIGDLHFAPNRIGHDRLAGGYAWRSLIDSGAVIVGGSDAPVERGDPRIEFYAAIARKDQTGFSNEDWYPQEKVTRAEALKMFTLWPAYSAFAEDTAGTIAVGKNADFTIFDKDIMTIPEIEILKVKTVMTIVDGKIIYKAP